MPLYLSYLAWWREYQHDPRPSPDPTIGQMGTFVRIGLTKVGETVAARPLLGALVIVALGVGILLVVAERPTVAAVRDRLTVPLTLLAGAVGFLLVTSRGRAVSYGSDYARSGRFAYTVVALSVPAIGVALSALLRRRFEVGLAVAAVLVIAMPLNLRLAKPLRQQPVTPGSLWLAGTDPDVRTLDPDTRIFPDQAGASSVRLGMLARWADEGRFPDDITVSDADRAEILARVLIAREPYEPSTTNCRRLDAGDRVAITGSGPALVTFGRIRFKGIGPDGATGSTIESSSLRPLAWAPVGPDLEIELVELIDIASASVCPAPG